MAFAEASVFAEPLPARYEEPRPILRALLAEADRDWRCAMKAALREMGYDVIETADGREALDSLREVGWVDLLVTDVIMPGLDGLSLILEARLRNPRMPVLAIAGGSNRLARLHSARVRGAAVVLAKPFSSWEFMNAVDHTVGR